MKKQILATILAVTVSSSTILPVVNATELDQYDDNSCLATSSVELDSSLNTVTSPVIDEITLTPDNLTMPLGTTHVIYTNLKSNDFIYPTDCPTISISGNSCIVVGADDYWKGWGESNGSMVFQLKAVSTGTSAITVTSADGNATAQLTVNVTDLADDAIYPGSSYVVTPPSELTDGVQDPTTGLYYHTKDDIRNAYNILGVKNFYSNNVTNTTFEVQPNIDSPFNMGAPSKAEFQKGLNSLAWERYLLGLTTSLSLDTGNNTQRDAQAGSILLSHYNQITHHLPQPEGMSDDLYREASNGINFCCAGCTNLAEAVHDWFREDKANKEQVGHRGIMEFTSSASVSMGISTDHYGAGSATFKSAGSNGNNNISTDIPVVTYPGEYIPYGDNLAEMSSVWSIELNPSYYDTSADRTNDIQVTINNLRTGETKVDRYDIANGAWNYVYNTDCNHTTVTFEAPKNMQSGDVFEVTIEGLAPENNSVSSTYTFTTEVFPIERGNFTSLEISQAPTKTTYEKGESLDTTGLFVLGKDSNGVAEALKSSEYTVSGYNSNKSGSQTVTVSLNSNLNVKTTFNVNVKSEMTGIEVTQLPDRTVYEKGEQNLDTSGLIISGVYDDGTTAPITGYTTSGFDTSTVGSKAITVSYTNVAGKTFTTTFNIEVTEMTGIEVTQLPVKTEYITGENIDTTGLIISGIFANGSKTQLSSYEVKPIDTSTPGEKTVIVDFYNALQNKTYSTSFKVNYTDYIPPIENGTYTISSALTSNKGIDISAGSQDNSANAQLYSSNGTNAQRFNLELIGKDTYKIVNLNSGKVLDVAAAGTSNGTNVQQYESNGSAAQQWILEDAGDGYYYIKSACNGLYLDVNAASVDNCTNIQVYAGNSSNAQKFKFNDIATLDDGVYTIKAVNSNKVFDIAGASSENSANLQIYDSNGSSAQQFYVVNQGNGWYEIKAKCSNRVLDVAAAGMTCGTNVQQYEPNGSAAQRWFLAPAGNGNYYIVSECNGLYLDIAGAGTSNGTNVQCYSDNGSVAQQFTFESVI